MNRLTEIANRTNVDKGTECYEKHSYTEDYVKYIPENGEYKLLEIGIWRGDSLRMWIEYNPELKVYGVDIDNNVYNYIKDSNDIKIYIGNQSDVVFLESIINETGNFNFIIDDGSHYYSDIMASFKFLYDSLIDGGYYIIEDLHASQSQASRVIDETIQWLKDTDRHFEKYDLLCDKKLLIIKK